MTRFIYNFT